MKQLNIKPTTTLSEYRNILVSELESVLGKKATALSKATIDRNEVILFAKAGNKKFKGVFKIWDMTLNVIKD